MVGTVANWRGLPCLSRAAVVLSPAEGLRELSLSAMFSREAKSLDRTTENLLIYFTLTIEKGKQHQKPPGCNLPVTGPQVFAVITVVIIACLARIDLPGFGLTSPEQAWLWPPSSQTRSSQT